jgi:hypothetical protein
MVHARKAADVAAELGLSRNAAYIARSRVLARLRQVIGEFLDESRARVKDRPRRPR